MGELNLMYYTFQSVCVRKYEPVRWTSCSFSPPGDTSGAVGGVAVHRGERQVKLPRLARPKGCFDTSAEWSYTGRRDASRADSDTRADYSLRHRRDGNAGTTILYHLNIYLSPHSSSGMTAGRRELLVMDTASASAGAA